LFADTGIGKAAYSIMEQGNIDMVLSNRPEERMEIFEEAAGITKYKMRMKESYKKLAATEENRIRLNLIINEVEKEYHSLEKQADKALEYKRLKKDELKYETLYYLEKVRNLKRQLEKNNSALDELQKKEKNQTTALNELDDTIKKKIDRVRNIEKDITNIKNDMYKIEADLESIDSKSEHIKDRIFEIENEISKKMKVREKQQNFKLELEEKIHYQLKEKEELSTVLISQEKKLLNYEEAINFISDSIQKCSNQIIKNTNNIEKIGKNILELREVLKEVTNKLLEEIDNLKTKFKGKERKKNELREKITESLIKIDKALSHYGTRIHDFIYTIEDSDRKRYSDELTEDIKNIKDRLLGIKKDIETVMSIQDELSIIIFGKQSAYSRKEKIEKNIEENIKKELAHKYENVRLNEELKKNGQKKEEFSTIINNLRPDIARNKEKRNFYEKEIKRLNNEIERGDESLEDVDFDINTLKERKKQFYIEKDKLLAQYGKFEDKREILGEKTKKQNALIDKIVKEIREHEVNVEKRKEQIEDISKRIDNYDRHNAELSSRIDTIIENFRERYSISLELVDADSSNESDIFEGFSEGKLEGKKINDLREKVKKEISELGQVNLIAIEEFNEVKKRFQYLTKQRNDLEKAKEDLNIVMSKTVQSSKELFMESFENIGKNFNGIFRRLFNGGKTDLYLTNDADIFESGIDIMACPPGKILRRRSLLSGGEKSLTAIALLFAIFMVKPSPFCMLDEVDHDLDEENVFRFIKLLKEFTDTTQFVIITHNRRTIEFADVIYGITAEEAGISTVVSLDMVEQALE
jgi:chromosome segregation protein